MKRALKILAIVIGIVIVVAIALPLFVNANTFRPKLESELTGAMGRQVTVGNLSLSVFSGGVTADNIAIADDPAFSKTPFVQAKSLKVGVELIPLIFSKALHVTDLTLNQPEISLVKSQNGETWNFSSLGNKGSTQGQPPAPSGANSTQPASSSSSTTPASSTPAISVAKLNVKEGRVTVSHVGSPEKPRVYDKVDIEVTGLSLTSSFPFKMSVSLPSGGNLTLDGNAGPVNPENAALTPVQAKVSVQQMNLATSGFIDPASGISGIADFDGTVSSDGHEAKTAGTLKVAKLQVVKKGSPAGEPVLIKYEADYNLAKQTGQLTQGDVTMGKALQHLTGTYDTGGATTSVNMKLAGQGMPVDDLEAMLPAMGVTLPSGSRLNGGTLSVNFSIVGPVDKLITTGTVRLENTALAGFNLGSKLSAISALSGKNTGGSNTTIQNFSSDVRVAPDGTKADNINLTVPQFGVLTGAGTVSPSNSLDFKMNASLSGLTQMVGLGKGGGSIPFFIQGTTSDPKFVPDVKGMASGLLKGVMGGSKSGQQNPVNNVLGLFKKKHN
ncbi:MAG TPA: AsmA family protein [Candidatus Aquilonibacter sp.]|nr:AsmA family protein [Candidatus Aquilonibacter sp.]